MNSRTRDSRTRVIKLALASVWTLVILALCSIPGSELPNVRIVSADKVGHFIMFAAFGFLWMHALRLEVGARFRWVIAAGLAYAVLTEVYQGLMPFGREPEAWDAVANSAGLLAGVGGWHFLSRLRKPEQQLG